MKRFDDLVVDVLPNDGKSYLATLKDLKFLEEHRNILMIGNSGTGETPLAMQQGSMPVKEISRLRSRLRQDW